MAEEFAVRAEKLTRSYAGRTVVDAINLNIPQGAMFGVLGPNGAGKSTTMRMIQGATPPDSGLLNVLGYAVPEQAAQMRYRLGVVPQIDNLDPDFTVYENLAMYGKYFRLKSDTLAVKIPDLLRFVELDGHEQANIQTLSGGMKRRLTFARALINNPDLIILDEPTTGLDPQVRHQIWEKCRELIEQGKTIILTTHYLEEAERLCNDLVIIDAGKILEHGQPKHLIQRHIEPEVIEIHDDKRALALLKIIPECRIEQAGTATYAYMQSAQTAMQKLHNAGIDCLLRRANLEDVFLKLTGRGLRI